VIAMDRAGLVGEDGPTHHGAFDIAMLRPVPNLILGAPRDCAVLSLMLREAVRLGRGPIALRYPRGVEPDLRHPAPQSIAPGSGQLLREGGDILLVGVGVMASTALEVAAGLEAEGISAGVWDPLWLKPMDMDGLVPPALCAGKVVCLEDGTARGGIGELLAAELCPMGVRVRSLGLPDAFARHGSRQELLREAGLDVASLLESVRHMLGEEPRDG
jgi:1-deoxy-D-xylulose-5-phosphate synthase